MVARWLVHDCGAGVPARYGSGEHWSAPKSFNYAFQCGTKVFGDVAGLPARRPAC